MKRILVATAALLICLGVLAPVADAASEPPPPTDVSVSTEPGVAVLRWSGSSAAAGYNVYRDGDYLTTVDASPYRDRVGSGVHTYYVTAFDSTKEHFSSRSSEVRADVRDSPERPVDDPAPERPDPSDDDSAPERPEPEPESRPEPPAATGGRLAPPVFQRIETVPGAAVLYFDTVDGAAGYNVYRDGEYLTTVSGSPHRDDSRPGNYTYHLTAFDSSKENFSTRSAELSVDTRGVTTATEDSTPDEVRPPNRPSFIEVVKKESFVSVVWRQGTDRKGVNVYRNNRFVGSVNQPGTVFNDRGGKVGDTYHLVAYGDNGTFSAESTKAFAESDVPDGSTRPTQASIFPMSVRAQGSNTVLSWTAQPGNPTYTVYRLRSDPTSTRVAQQEWTTDSTSFTAPRVSNDLYFVAVLNGQTVVSATGLYNWQGQCVGLCNVADWSTTSVQARAVPAIVIGVLLREAARRAARWCASNPRSCTDAIGDAVNVGSKIYDTFIDDNPASVIASQQVDDLKDQGFRVTGTDSSTGTMTLQNGGTTVTVRAVETQRGEAGRVLTTTTTTNARGQVVTVRVELDDVSERLADDRPQVDTNYTSIRTNYYDLAGNLIGYSVQVYRDGVPVGVDCSGQAASTGCGPTDDDDEPAPEPGNGPLDDPDGDGIPSFLDPDQDGDGIPNTIDADPTTPHEEDSDGDGIVDSEDPDRDGDGIPNNIDRYPDTPYTPPTPTPTPDDDDDDPPTPPRPDPPGPCEGSMDAAASCG